MNPFETRKLQRRLDRAISEVDYYRSKVDYHARRADSAEETARAAFDALVSLRRRLREADPTLPHEYDGPKWQAIEEEHLTPAARERRAHIRI